MKRAFAVAAVAVAALTARGAIAQVAVAEGQTAAVLPERTYLHFSIPDIEELKTRFNATQGSGLFTGPEFEDLRERVLEQYEELNDQAEREIDLSLDDLLGVAKTHFSLAVTEPDDGVLSLVIFVGIGDDTSTVDSIVEKIQDAYKEQGADVEETEVGGVEIVNCFIPNTKPDPEAFSFNYFIADGMWVIGTNRTVLESVVDRWGGDGDNLAGDELYREVMDKVDLGFGREAALEAFFNPIELIQAVGGTVAQVDPQTGAQINMGLGFLPLTGLQNLRCIGSKTDFGGAAGEGMAKTFTMITQPTTGLLKIGTLREQDQTPPEWVPAEASTYQAFTWSVEDAYAAVEGLVDQFQGRGATERFMDQIAEMPDGPGLHIKDDIIDQLEGTISTFTVPNKGTTTELTPEDLASIGGKQVFALRLNRTHNAGEVLEKIAEAAEGELESRDFRGTTVYEFGGGGPMVGGVAVVNDNIVVATDVELLENVIRGGGGNSLANTDAFQKATEGFPQNAAALVYADPAEQIRAIYEPARNGAFDDLIKQADDNVPVDLIISVLRDLPAFADIEKYFGYSAGYTVIEDDGYLGVRKGTARD